MARQSLLLSIILGTVASACARSAPSPLAGADAGRGKEAIMRYGCAACHTIPGIEGAAGIVGPSLEHVATRQSLGGGRIPNTPGNMIKWIQHPQQIDPKNSMPELGVTDVDARDIAAYLYTLKSQPAVSGCRLAVYGHVAASSRRRQLKGCRGTPTLSMSTRSLTPASGTSIERCSSATSV